MSSDLVYTVPKMSSITINDFTVQYIDFEQDLCYCRSGNLTLRFFTKTENFTGEYYAGSRDPWYLALPNMYIEVVDFPGSTFKFKIMLMR